MKPVIAAFIIWMLTLGLVDHVETQYKHQLNISRHNTVCRSCPLIVKAMEHKHEYAGNTQQ